MVESHPTRRFELVAIDVIEVFRSQNGIIPRFWLSAILLKGLRGLTQSPMRGFKQFEGLVGRARVLIRYTREIVVRPWENIYRTAIGEDAQDDGRGKDLHDQLSPPMRWVCRGFKPYSLQRSGSICLARS
jgi:hypothetical protein